MDHGYVSVRFRHPSRELTFLSEVLNLTPFRTWSVGESRETPKGRSLPDAYTHSYWVSRFEFEPKNGFKDQLVQVLELLLQKQATVHELSATGGTLEIYIQMPGWINNGDTIAVSLLQDIVVLGATLSVEVFPN